MKVRNVVPNVVSALAGCALLMVSLQSAANGLSDLTAPSAFGRYDMHSLNNNAQSAIPLLSISLTASTHLMKGNSLDLSASYSSVGLNPVSNRLGYKVISTDFSVNAPQIRSLDFSKAIREKVENCPEKMLDKLIIDGAVGLNYSW